MPLLANCNLTLENVRQNAIILDVPFIPYAESMNFTHEYDTQLDEASTQSERYLLLSELIKRSLAQTNIFKKTVGEIIKHCTCLGEFIELRLLIGKHNPEIVEMIKKEEDGFYSKK